MSHKTPKSSCMDTGGFFLKHPPLLPLRGIHLDFKGLPPTPKRLLELIEIVALARYNVIIVEWEDMFPWNFDKSFRSPHCYSPGQIRRFREKAEEFGIGIIPLVQSIGHMENVLRHPKYRHLRELPHDSFCLNPMAKDSARLVQGIIDDVLELLPDARYFHLGGDEAWSLGKGQGSGQFVARHGKAELYLKYMEPFLENLRSCGIRPMLWHDMMIEWDEENLRRIAAQADLVTWGYLGHPDNSERHYATRHIEKLHKSGVQLWAGTAYKGADGQSADIPDIPKREENAVGWMDIAKRYAYKGAITTGWSRYSTHRIQCEPIDACLDSLVEHGIILHDGETPAGGIKSCVEFLETAGEKKRFEKCRKSMDDLKSLRQKAWRIIQSLHEQFALSEEYPERKGSFMECIQLNLLKDEIKAADRIATDVKNTFSGLVPAASICEYLDVRLHPLRTEYNNFDARIKKLDPPAWRAFHSKTIFQDGIGF